MSPLGRAAGKIVAFSISKDALVTWKLCGSSLQLPLCGGSWSSRVLSRACELWHTAMSRAKIHSNVPFISSGLSKIRYLDEGGYQCNIFDH